VFRIPLTLFARCRVSIHHTGEGISNDGSP
jgi:hypothetical protein